MPAVHMFRTAMHTAMVATLATVAVAAAAGGLTGVPQANPKIVGVSVPTVLSPELRQFIVTQGSTPLENGAPDFPFYGYNGDGPMVPAPGDVQAPGHNVEATKTEPDKNTYLILSGQHGLDPDYDYGTHFLFQGHEGGIGNPKKGYITRINLDADGSHRLTLLASTDVDGNSLPVFDGSTWDPWAQRLLLTAENGSSGGVWQATVDYPSTVEDISGALGRGGYEGIQNDSDGNLWIAEDVGGSFGTVNVNARQPNSFIYRFVPKDPTDLKAGKLQALQVLSLASGQPIVFHAGQADADILSQDVQDLHTYGNVFQTTWVTIHNTDTDGTAPFDANALAKAAGATPFKRPENGLFRPGTDFREFYFDETGDTDIRTQAGAQFGGFGAVMKLTQAHPSADTGTLTMFFRGDPDHAAFDNVAFWSADQVVFVEDRGDTLHTQHNALDSAFLFDLNADYSDANTPPPLRLIAQGRDASATIDSALLALVATTANGFQNDGDNELTGIHISDGDPTKQGILGAKRPRPFRAGWRVFYTQQHGDNITYEIRPK
jgi:hypothetical protein